VAGLPARAPRHFRLRPFHQKYLGYEYKGERLKLPMVNVRLRGLVTSLRTPALVDSGATLTFIPPELAEAVGLQLVEKNAEATGAGGDFANDLYEYEMEILQGAQIIHPFRGRAFVPQEEGRVPYVILGRDAIFQEYDITFRERLQRVVFRPSRGAP
jgi:hypothetical protein